MAQRSLAATLADSLDTYIEIIECMAGGVLPKEIRKPFFDKCNEYINNKEVRRVAFNSRQLRKNGFSRIN